MSRVILPCPNRNSWMIRLPCSRCSRERGQVTRERERERETATRTEQTIVQTMHRSTDVFEFSTWTSQCIDDVLGMARLRRRAGGEQEMASQEHSRRNN